MPPLWKKNKKPNPITRFVNDIRSSRHGESLVVQTGFPTSLIDLVVKNRGRFVKSKNCGGRDRYDGVKPKKDPCRQSLKKENIKDKDNTSPDQDSRFNHQQQENKKCLDQDVKSKESVVILERKDGEKEKDRDCCKFVSKLKKEQSMKVKRKGGFTKMVKVLFLLILGLGSKKVAVAITVSAFVLLFIEFLLRSCVGWRGLRECGGNTKVEEEANLVDLRKEFEALVKETRIKEIEIECENDEGCDESAEVSEDDRGRMRVRFVEFESDKDGEGDRKQEVMVEGDERVIECEKVRCRRKLGGGKITAKQFRKYVVKKFGGDSKSRRRKKDGKLARKDGQSNCDGDGEVDAQSSVGKESVEEEQEKDEEGDENDDVEGNVVVEYDCKCVSEASSEVGSQDDMGRRTKWNLKTLVLVVIVLAGLVGGRIVAMVLSIVWLVLVLALTKQRRSSVTTRQERG